jgi:hypothetical protein
MQVVDFTCIYILAQKWLINKCGIQRRVPLIEEAVEKPRGSDDNYGDHSLRSCLTAVCTMKRKRDETDRLEVGIEKKPTSMKRRRGWSKNTY